MLDIIPISQFYCCFFRVADFLESKWSHAKRQQIDKIVKCTQMSTDLLLTVSSFRFLSLSLLE